MKQIILILICITLSGCAVGKSWDTPGNESDQYDIPDLNNITFYIDGNGYIMKGAPCIGEANNLTLIETQGELPKKFPSIKLNITAPEYKTNIITGITSLPSFLTFSVLPGYFYKSSDANFELSIPTSSGELNKTTYNYKVKRHYFSWLPLLPAKNFISTVQVHSEPQEKWHRGYEETVCQFLEDSKKIINEYRISLRK